MKNNYKLQLISLVFLLSVLLVGCNSEKSDATDDVIELEVNNWSPPTHYMTKLGIEPWKELVEEKTQGRVKVNIHSGGSMGEVTSVHGDLAGGLYDVSVLLPAYFEDTEFFPYTIGNLPFALEGPEATKNVLNKFAKEYVEEDINDHTIMGGAASSNVYDLITIEPITSIDDLKGKDIRSSSKSDANVIKAIGSVPVSFPLTETYESMQKGSTFGSFNSPISVEAYKFYEPAPYLTEIGFQVMPAIGLMNNEFYSNLPDDLKKIFDDELNPAFLELLTETYVDAKVDIDKALEDKVERSTLSDDELEKFKEKSIPAWDSWIEAANEKGYPGEEMVETFFEILEEEGYEKPY